MNIHSFPCAVTADLNRYLTQLDRENLWQEAVESRQKALLAENGDYYPFAIDNLSEAIGDIELKNIAALLKAGNYEEAGETLTELVIAYWERKTQLRVNREIENEQANACPNCRGRGCRYCEE